MSLGDKTQKAIQEIKQIIEKHGKNGWLRIKECEKYFIKHKPNENPETRHRRFYRLIKKIKEGKINELQHVEIGKKAWIGLKEADPSALKAKPSLIRQNLIKRFWKEEEQIENENLYGDPVRAYNKAVFLILKLPEPYKQRLSEPLKQIKTKLNRINNNPFIIEYRRMLMKHDYLQTKAVPKLIEKINEQLYQMQKEIEE